MRSRPSYLMITLIIAVMSLACEKSGPPMDIKSQTESGRAMSTGEAKADGNAISWDDPAGDAADVSNVPGWPRPDIIKVRAEGKEGFIHFEVRTASPLTNFFDYIDPVGKKRGEVLVSFLVDTDNNTATGARPLSGDRNRTTGFEYEIKVLLGYEYVDRESGAAMFNTGNIVFDAAKYDIKSNVADYHIWRLLEGLRRENVRRDPSDSEKKFREFVDMGSDSIRIRVPYSILGLKSGDKIRVCFKDELQGVGDDYSGEAVLKLE
ncbi:MAG: hypothetical protein HZA15_11010 [Nitrospirae bacterium]|nr:hypothetical protein [Nitrospirota bacterium]